MNSGLFKTSQNNPPKTKAQFRRLSSSTKVATPKSKMD
jgi:hypothetical protein